MQHLNPHQVKATTGRWQKNKDVFWYTRDKTQSESQLDDELRAVKQREEELMAEVGALGWGVSSSVAVCEPKKGNRQPGRDELRAVKQPLGRRKPATVR